MLNPDFICRVRNLFYSWCFVFVFFSYTWSSITTDLSECRPQLLKVFWEVCLWRQLLYSQEGGQWLDQVSCQVHVISPQCDLIGQIRWHVNIRWSYRQETSLMMWMAFNAVSWQRGEAVNWTHCHLVSAELMSTCPLLAMLMDKCPPPLRDVKVTSGLSTPFGSRKFWFSHITTCCRLRLVRI